ncbi:LysR family transcriptional regulator [Murdochiella vaginalis]|uniref:LysR family transcriptional regulator n=1 Tax=Murdochiella vaginalis TaxID=1852373 RepID=UPI0008FE6DCB|nr:LysR family transcriptional regulator [Murdochiella vaginalis]
MFDRRYYTYVKAVEKSQNFTRAAEQLYISQPALSRFIKRVENEFGIVLFDRDAMPTKLTKQGKIYLSYMEKFLAMEKEMKSKLIGHDQNETDVLSIATIPLLGVYVLPKVIPSFANQYPTVNLEVSEGPIFECLDMIRKRKADILLTNMIPEDPDLEHMVLAADPIMLVARQKEGFMDNEATDFSPFNPEKIDYSQLIDEPFIVLRPWQNIRLFANQFFSYYGLKPKELIEAPSLASALGLVESGKGITFQTFSSLMSLQPSSNLRYFSAGQLENVTSILAVYHKGTKKRSVEHFCQRAKLVLAEKFSMKQMKSRRSSVVQ